jgi:hypothetical protein
MTMEITVQKESSILLPPTRTPWKRGTDRSQTTAVGKALWSIRAKLQIEQRSRDWVPGLRCEDWAAA